MRFLWTSEGTFLAGTATGDEGVANVTVSVMEAVGRLKFVMASEGDGGGGEPLVKVVRFLTAHSSFPGGGGGGGKKGAGIQGETTGTVTGSICEGLFGGWGYCILCTLTTPLLSP